LAISSYEYGLERGVRWNFIDCIPPLAPFFKAFGWIEHLPEAKHPEYPFSVKRMKLDLEDEEHLSKLGSPFLSSYRKFRCSSINSEIPLPPNSATRNSEASS
jgi:hypothetical protein